MTDLSSIRRGWDRAATQNAFFNIVTIHGLSEEEFWQMGRDEIDGLMVDLGNQHFYGCDRALDFGCGIGRLTQALEPYFLRVDGVDISGEMIRLANEHNTSSNVYFHHNPKPDLPLFGNDTFDLAYTSIVLQHMPSEYAGRYVRELIRVVRPGGFVVFQIPEGFDVAAHGSEWLSMYGTSRETVESWLDGGVLVEAQSSEAAGAFASYRYMVQVGAD